MSARDEMAQNIKKAGSDGYSLSVEGAGTKSFIGYVDDRLKVLKTKGYSGVLDYHPSELVVRVKSGTPVCELSDLLQEEGQMLAFDPPQNSSESTIGGVVSAGLSGSARPYRGAARDHLLGVGMLLHDGSYCEFGGQVMKNVAGYDVSRLVCGAYGTLGVLADVSMKVLPIPELQKTVKLECSFVVARDIVKRLSRTASPLSATCYFEGVLNIRLSGSEHSVNSAAKLLGGEHGDFDFWSQLDSQNLAIFQNASDIWRLSTNPDEPFFDREFSVMDWGFSQRWLFDPLSDPRKEYKGSGHWTRIRNDSNSFFAPVFQPLSSAAFALHRRLKSELDPKGIFNPGRMYREEGL